MERYEVTFSVTTCVTVDAESDIQAEDYVEDCFKSGKEWILRKLMEGSLSICETEGCE